MENIQNQAYPTTQFSAKKKASRPSLSLTNSTRVNKQPNPPRPVSTLDRKPTSRAFDLSLTDNSQPTQVVCQSSPVEYHTERFPIASNPYTTGVFSEDTTAITTSISFPAQVSPIRSPEPTTPETDSTNLDHLFPMNTDEVTTPVQQLVSTLESPLDGYPTSPEKYKSSVRQRTKFDSDGNIIKKATIDRHSPPSPPPSPRSPTKEPARPQPMNDGPKILQYRSVTKQPFNAYAFNHDGIDAICSRLHGTTCDVTTRWKLNRRTNSLVPCATCKKTVTATFCQSVNVFPSIYFILLTCGEHTIPLYGDHKTSPSFWQNGHKQADRRKALASFDKIQYAPFNAAIPNTYYI